MRTVQEIQEAITQLPEEARLRLLQWIHSHEDSDQAADDPELFKEAQLGAQQLDAGAGVSLEQARKLTSRWTTK